MSSESVAIAEPVVTNTSRLYYEISLRSATGEPVSDQELKVALAGDGSLAPGFDSKEIVRRTGEDGVAHVTWYRRNIWGRAVKATLTVSAASEDAQLRIEQRDEPPPEETGPRTGWTLQRRRF
jgi:hypothetical protein